jgi:ribosomal-protein-alanine N-acetyltransferase
MPTPLKIKVRPMTEADLERVLEIETASFPNPWKREHFVDELEAHHSFPYVAVDDDCIVGYVCLMSLFEEAQILDIAVDPGLRGRGVARMLMKQAIAASVEKGAELLTLEVRASNIAAITLYEQCGFIRTGLRQKYYESFEDAVLMGKALVDKCC